MRRRRARARDDHGRSRAGAQGDARMSRGGDQRSDRGGGASRAGGRVGRPRRQSADHGRSLPRRPRRERTLCVSRSARPRRDPGVSSHRVEVAIFAIAFAIFGLVAFALVWSGDWAYAALANVNGVKGTTFTSKLLTTTSVEWSVDLPALVEWHRRWTAYVIGLREPPAGLGTFSGAEYEHMADVLLAAVGAHLALRRASTKYTPAA